MDSFLGFRSLSLIAPGFSCTNIYGTVKARKGPVENETNTNMYNIIR